MSHLLLDSSNISSSGIVTVYLLVIVFAVLGFLVVVLWLGEKGKTLLAKRKKTKVAPTPELPVAAPVEALPATEEEEEVAAVMAAIYVVLQADTPQKRARFVVKRIERI